MLIDLLQLRTFVAVAEERHLTRAAERLHVSQSAASAHVRAVEESLGAQLFVRTNRNLELTGIGQALFRRAKGLLSEAAMFTSFARELRSQVDGNLIVAANSEPVSSRIGQVIAGLRATHPLVTVDLFARPSSVTRQGLKTGEVDVGLLLGTPVDAEFTYYPLTMVRYRIAGPVSWRERLESADWAELASLPWMVPADSSLAYSTTLSRLFADKGLDLNIVVRFDNSTLARALIPDGVGLMLIPEEHALQGEREGRFALSPLGRVEFLLLVAHLSSRGADPLIKAFLTAAGTAWPEIAFVPCLPLTGLDESLSGGAA